MQTLCPYSNQSIDAANMVSRLHRHLGTPTGSIAPALEALDAAISQGIRDYKNTEALERERGDLLLLLQARQNWSMYCSDDCSHWIGAI